MILTSTEGGKGESDNRAHISFTSNLKKGWKDIKSYQKDWMPFIFGFGRILFGADLDNNIYLSGLALKNLDEVSLKISFEKIVKKEHTYDY